MIYDPIAELLGAWSKDLSIGSIILRVALSVVLAAVIGWERSSKRHAAGLRTFILVSFACTVAMILDLWLVGLVGGAASVLAGAAVIAVAILSGNSILFSSRNQIKGLTTSAGLWACGIIGLASGAGLYMATLISFVTLLCSLSFFPRFEKYLKNRSNHFEVHLELKTKENLQDFVTTIRRLGLKIDDIESNPAYMGSGLSVYSVAMTIKSEELKRYKTHTEIIEALRTLDYVYYIEEMD